MLYFWYYVISVINKNFQFTFRLQTCNGVFVYWPFIFLLYCIHLIRSCVFGRFLQIFNITMKSLKIVYYFFILIYALFYFFCLFFSFFLCCTQISTTTLKRIGHSRNSKLVLVLKLYIQILIDIGLFRYSVFPVLIFVSSAFQWVWPSQLTCRMY